MTNQLYTLLAYFIAGIIISILFDIFRITRKSFKTPNFLIYIEDILFWLLTGAIVLFTTFTVAFGEIRLYMILIMIFSSFLYFTSISKYFISINSRVLDFIKSIIIFLLKPLKIIKKFKFFSKKGGK